MKSIAFFNNKGGVGKTTLACNTVSFLNEARHKRVLLIDADPQCNATQAILNDEICEDIYLNLETTHKTLYTYLSPLEQGEPGIDTSVVPILGSTNRFNTDIIPGHPRMSIIEDRISGAWQALQGRDIPGYRITNWCTQLLKTLEPRYDLVVFDVGPSLGALNRSVILASDYIVTPFGCDIFSLLGIRNISSWIDGWKRQYDRSILDARADHPTMFASYPIIENTDDKFRFAGYSVQQYITKTFKTGRRPVKSYEKIMQKIPSTVSESMRFLLPPGLSEAELELGHIPNLFSLIPMAQSAKSPIHKLSGGDGIVGSQYAQVKDYAALMSNFCDRLLANLETDE